LLDRSHATHTRTGERRLRDGSDVHRRIGGRADRLATLDRATRVAAIVIILLMVYVVLQSLGVIQLLWT
jgi:hypothetical protein